MTIIAFDLGKHPHVAVMSGTWKAPVLHEARRFKEWNPAELTVALREWKARYGEVLVCCERTFTWRETKRDKRRYHRDTGRQQEGMAGALEMMCHFLGIEFRRVEPCGEGQAYTAWTLCGRLPEYKVEHYKDAMAVGLKGIITLEEEAKDKAMGIAI